MHLRVPDALADLALVQIVHEAQLENRALHIGQPLPGAGNRVAIPYELVRDVLAAEQVDKRRGIAVVTRRWGVERRGFVAAGGLLRLEYLLDGAPERGGYLPRLGRPSKFLRERLGLPTHRERALLKVAWHVQRPALVAEVTLQLAQNGGCGKARELRAAIRIEPVDRFDQPEARHLHEVVERLIRIGVAPRKITCERQESLHELLACRAVAHPVVADQQRSFKRLRRSALAAFG